MSLPNSQKIKPKDAKSCTRSILNGDISKCFTEEELVFFLTSDWDYTKRCIRSKHIGKNMQVQQYRMLLFSSWYLPGVRINTVLKLTTKHVKWSRQGVIYKIDKKKYPILLESLRDTDPLSQLINKLRDFVNNVQWLSSVQTKDLYLFPEVRGSYVRNGATDLTRNLRYYLPTWIDNYNKNLYSIQ